MGIQEFLDFLQYEKLYSKHTITSYKNDLKQFAQFLTETGINALDDVTEKDCRKFVSNLSRGSYSKTSINRKITAIRSLYNFLLKREVVLINPAKRITYLKKEKKLPTFVEEKKMNELLDSNDIFGDDFEGVRDRLIIELLYCTGIRLSELIALQVKDADLKRQEIKVTGKRKKQRLIPLQKDIRSLLEIYLKKRSDMSCSNQSLFVTKNGKKAYSKLVYRVVNRYLALITTLQKKSPHVLRHSFATHMLNKGADLNAVKEILGHANLSATEVYTHNTFDKIKSIYKQAHPRD